MVVLLSSCAENVDPIEEQSNKAEIMQHLLTFYSGVHAYCLPGCEDGEEMTYNDLYSYIEASFPTELFVMESDTVLAKYTEEGFYIYMVPAGTNTWGYEGLFDAGRFSKDDLISYDE